MTARTLAIILATTTVSIAGCDRGMSPTAPSSTALAGGVRNHWETGTGGCTPGYWKQPQHFDSWPSDLGDGMENFELSPDLDFNDAFDLGANSPWVNVGDMTLLDALNLNGGGLNALLRQAAAALLNATLEFYPLSWEQVRQMFYEAHAANTPEAIENLKDIFDRYNNGKCPLN